MGAEGSHPSRLGLELAFASYAATGQRAPAISLGLSIPVFKTVAGDLGRWQDRR